MKLSFYRTIAIYACLLIFLSVLVFSCKKKKEEEPAPEENNTPTAPVFASQKDADLAENSFSDADRETDVIMKDTLFYKMEFKCPQINFIDTVSPIKKIDLDYGLGCIGKDGKLRKGIIHLTFGMRFSDSLSFSQAVFDNFYVENVKIEGKKGKTNLGRTFVNNKWCLTFGVIDSGRVIKGNDTLPLYSQKRWYWIGGEFTKFNNSDDTLLVRVDSLMGENRNGELFYGKTPMLPQPPYLLKLPDCRWFVSGIIDIRGKNDTALGRIDYGNGFCDSIASVSYKNSTYTIPLR